MLALKKCTVFHKYKLKNCSPYTITPIHRKFMQKQIPTGLEVKSSIKHNYGYYNKNIYKNYYITRITNY